MKYEQIMDRIELTPEMRQRVLQNIQAEQTKKKKRLTRQLFSLAACLAVVLCCWIAWKPKQPKQPQDQEQGIMGIAQIETVDSLDALSETTGIPLKELTGLPFAVEHTEYVSYWKELAEIQYFGGTDTLRYRKSLGTEDNSGDYNVYDRESTFILSGCAVTLKGSADGDTLAVWTDGTYAYSVSVSSPMPEEAFWDWLAENFETP